MFGNSTRLRELSHRRGHGMWTPYDNGLAAASYDPGISGSNQVTNGVIYLAKLHMAVPTLITTIHWYIGGGAVSPVAGQNEVALINPAGTRVAVTNVDAVTTSTGIKATAISSQLLVPPFCWAAFLFNAATPPTLRSQDAAGPSNNVGLSAATYRYATAGTGQTSIPASITPGSNVQTSLALWVAVGPAGN